MGKYVIREKHLDTTQGWVEYGRYCYQCHECKKYNYPADEELELSGISKMSPKKEDHVAYLSVQMPYQQASDTYEKLVELPASSSVIHRVVQAMGMKMKAEEVKHKPVKGEGRKHVGADGVMVNIKDEGWKEIKIGAYYCVDKTEEKEKQEVRYVATSESRDKIGHQLYDLSGKPDFDECKELGFISDGAAWLEDIRIELFSTSVGILDFYHAAEYVGAVGKSFYEEADAKKWITKWLKELKKGGVKKVVKHFRNMVTETGDQYTSLENAKRYFKNQRHKMKYDEYQEQGFHIGSGVIEAGCKHVIQNRFKRAGMRWSRVGFENLIPLRLAYVNNDWGEVQQIMWN